MVDCFIDLYEVCSIQEISMNCGFNTVHTVRSNVFIFSNQSFLWVCWSIILQKPGASCINRLNSSWKHYLKSPSISIVRNQLSFVPWKRLIFIGFQDFMLAKQFIIKIWDNRALETSNFQRSELKPWNQISTTSYSNPLAILLNISRFLYWFNSNDLT